MDQPEYTRWNTVPAHLRTATQLAALDLPRQPAGPVRATIATRNPGTGRKDEFDLYDLGETRPTPATAAQLTAAAARRTTNTRTCTDCGAHPETPCTFSSGDGDGDGGRVLCGTCLHITHLRTRQAEARAAARDVTATAARLLADEHLAVLHVDYTPGEPTAGGNPRPPAAARLVAVDRTGAPFCDRTVRLTGPRTPGAPIHATDPAQTMADLAGLLAERTIVIWTPTDLDPLYDALRRLKLNTALLPEGRVNTLYPAATQWRADLDPRTGEHRGPHPARHRRPPPPPAPDGRRRRPAHRPAGQPGGDAPVTTTPPASPTPALPAPAAPAPQASTPPAVLLLDPAALTDPAERARRPAPLGLGRRHPLT
ncbi:hypothetical protein [Streptomyces sp. CBMA156]|uniref:hypothetical protein n=1 Tax=Streptomyces sp. CBMA156 TaxID=1930280 RepID=UPI001661F253|nr:hypothetical protein [Streptomyces sp. CBMA156]MBD0671656.1 hypothetical protein [Streptomyces sp. CBMA156]